MYIALSISPIGMGVPVNFTSSGVALNGVQNPSNTECPESSPSNRILKLGGKELFGNE